MQNARDVKLVPTDEQRAVLSAYKDGDGVLEAYAGTGKTATLRLLAQDDPRSKFHLVCYNRSIADDAKRSFPRNTTCQTMHSIAFRSVGVEYKHRLNGPRMRAKDVAAILGISSAFQVSDHNFLRPWQLAGMVNNTVKRFCYSDAEVPGPEHVQFLPGAETKWDELSHQVAKWAVKAWMDITQLDGRLKFEHDHYLKMWALTHPVIRCDYLLLDEAQDSNPVIAQVVNEQDAIKIMVGDQYQQLYAWRGARDAMREFHSDWRLLLSQSFRFGPAVAAEANKWLTLLGATEPVKGLETIEDEVRELPSPKTILARTNATVIAEAMRVQEEGNTVAIVGGTGEIMSFARAVQDLQSGRQTSHPDLMAFANWTEVKEYTTEEGGDLKVLVDMIDRYGVAKVMEVADKSISEEYADTIVSTAHKAKGREWRSVRLAGDFKEPIDPDTGERKINRAEFQLLYVACTRAKRVLDNSAVSWVDEWLEEFHPQAPVGSDNVGDINFPPDSHEPNGRTIPVARRKRQEQV